MTHTEPSRYFSYLIRIWEAHTDGEKVWRASLERPGSKERQGFSNMDALFDFIREDVSRQPSEDVGEE